MFNDLVAFFRDVQTFEAVMLAIAGAIWLLLLLHSIFFGLRLAFRRVEGSGAASVPLSVIVVERNEEENLREKLPGWLSRDIPIMRFWWWMIFLKTILRPLWGC